MRCSSLAIALALLGCNGVQAVNEPADGGASSPADSGVADGAADAGSD